MGIRFYCPECDRRMNVKSFLAGKRGICPHCDARWDVPLESEIPEGAPKIRSKTAPRENAAQALGASTASAAGLTAAKPRSTANNNPTPSLGAIAPATPDPIDAAPDAVWYVRPASGGEFGPARGDVMRRWIEEGRVGADSMVWREGWAEWQLAGPVFPALAPAAEQPTTTPAETGLAPKTLSNVASIQKKTAESNGRPARKRSIGSGKSIALVVILGLLIVALFVVLIVVIRK